MPKGWNHGHFQVHPRYIAGPPATVDFDTALAVAKNETHSFSMHLEGIQGPDQQALAKTLGTGGIVEWTLKKHGSTVVFDVLTRKWYLYDPPARYLSSWYYGCNPKMRAIKVVRAYGGRGYPMAVHFDVYSDDEVTSIMSAASVQRTRNYLGRSRYRRPAPYDWIPAWRTDVEREIHEALKQIGVTWDSRELIEFLKRIGREQAI
jgi:hypothetical protein